MCCTSSSNRGFILAVTAAAPWNVSSLIDTRDSSPWNSEPHCMQWNLCNLQNGRHFFLLAPALYKHSQTNLYGELQLHLCYSLLRCMLASMHHYIWNKLFLNVLLNKVNIFSTSSGNLTFFADNLLGYLATCHMICFLLFLCQMNHFLPFLNFWYIATVSDYIKESSILKNLLAYLQRCCFPN